MSDVRHVYSFTPGEQETPEHAAKQPKLLQVQLDVDDATQLLWLLDRALNSLQPEKWPAIADPLSKHLEKFLGRE